MPKPIPTGRGMTDPQCPICHEETEPATIRRGTRVGYYCSRCGVLFADGETRTSSQEVVWE
jgi:ribosomal protein L37AE/L43A